MASYLEKSSALNIRDYVKESILALLRAPFFVVK